MPGLALVLARPWAQVLSEALQLAPLALYWLHRLQLQPPELSCDAAHVAFSQAFQPLQVLVRRQQVLQRFLWLLHPQQQ